MEFSDPILQFSSWWQNAIEDSPLNQKSAVCISTINSSGYPDGRFVDLKQVDENGFVFCTYMNSQKGEDIANNAKIAMTAWWDHVGYQVRIVGNAEQISCQQALQFWQTRSRSAQLITKCFSQSKPISGPPEIASKFNLFESSIEEQAITIPDNWGGYNIRPDSIEFLTFKETRLHIREKFIRSCSEWDKIYLQP